MSIEHHLLINDGGTCDVTGLNLSQDVRILYILAPDVIPARSRPDLHR